MESAMADGSRRAEVEHSLANQRGLVPAKAVRDYWNAHPLAVDEVPHEAGTRESIEALYDRYLRSADEHRAAFLESCRGKRVLEVGCGIGVDSRFLVENGIDYRAVDYSIESLRISRKMVAAGGRSCDLLNADAASLPFRDAEFDMAFSIGVLHHVPEMATACRELVRVVKPGGTVRVMLYNRHSYHYAVVRYVLLPAIWLGLRLPGIGPVLSRGPSKVRHMYEIAKRHGYDVRRLLSASTDTSYAGEGNFNPLSRFVTEREVREIFDELEDFRFFRMMLPYFPLPGIRRAVELRWGFYLTFTARKSGAKGRIPQSRLAKKS